MHLRRHIVPGVALALVLLAIVAFVASSNRSVENELQPTPSATSTDATTTPTEPSGSAEESNASVTPTRIVRENSAAEAPVSTTLRTAATPKATATLVVEGNSYGLNAPAGATLKEALDRLQGESSFTYAYRNYTGLGAFVTHINGRASTGEFVWILYVNGAKSSTGISATRIREGDVFEWKLEESY